MINHVTRVRNLRRYYKIIAVFARHGFGSFLETLQVDRYLPLPLLSLRKAARPEHLTRAEHLRLALEELGPTFIKLGQILSTRPDLFPAEYIVELTKLQDNVPPTSWDTIHALLLEEYGCDPGQIFSSIDPNPLGSASLAQVHAARLQDGRQVVLKVQRPFITRTIEADLSILAELAHLAQRTAWGQIYDPVEIVSHFSSVLQNELDYRREGINADRFRANFADEKHLYIPEVFWEHSNRRVLVMERLEGIRIDDRQALDAAGIDRRELARIASGILIREIIEDGFFHADPHPGNFVMLPCGPESALSQEERLHATRGKAEIVIGAMDFGMAGFLSAADRLNLAQIFTLAVRKETRGIVDLLVRIGAIGLPIESNALERDIDRLLNQYAGLPLKHIQASRVIEDLMQLAFRYHIRLPADFWLLFKTLTMMDGLARQLDPDFNLFSVFGPRIRKVVTETRLPWVWGPGFLSDLESLAFAVKDIPSIAEGVLRGLQRGELPFSVNMGANKETLDRLDRLSTRFSLSVLVAAFILGLALLLPVATGNPVALVLVVIGFVAAFSLGVWLVVSILRAGK